MKIYWRENVCFVCEVLFDEGVGVDVDVGVDVGVV